MTDEEVKKGLEYCAVEVKCNACPYVTDRNCREQMNTDALALINRLEEEKEKLLYELYCAEGKIEGKTAKNILQSFARFRALSPVLSAAWYALAEKYGVEVSK